MASKRGGARTLLWICRNETCDGSRLSRIAFPSFPHSLS